MPTRPLLSSLLRRGGVSPWDALDYASCGAAAGHLQGCLGPLTPAQISQYAASPLRYGQPLETVARPLGSPELRADASVPKTYDLGGQNQKSEVRSP